MHFYCEKNTCGQKPEQGGLIDPLEVEEEEEEEILFC